MLIAALALLTAFHLTPIAKEAMEVRLWLDHFDDRGWKSEALFTLVASLLIAAGTPRLLFFGLAGLLFGVVDGLIAAMVASMTGSYLAFRIVRWGCREWVIARFGQRRFFQKITETSSSVLTVFLIRQLPISNLFINASLALSEVRTRVFLLGSLLGFAPQGAVAVLIGSGIAEDTLWQGFAQLGAAAAWLLAVSFFSLRRRSLRRKSAGISTPSASPS